MSSNFNVLDTPIQGLKTIQRNPIGDHRGYLERVFCTHELATLLPDGAGIVQINHTLTTKSGTVRGMHFQHPPHAEIKFVSCLKGRVFDVAVDLRSGSSTFLHWHAEMLTADNYKTLAIPEGFAHGFQTLTENVEMLYLHTTAYEPSAEEGVNATDPRLNIQWPKAFTERSPRDLGHPFIAQEFAGIAL